MLDANFTQNTEAITVNGLTQWDKGQKLQITGIENLPAVFQVHFANYTLAEAIIILGNTTDGVGVVDIPNSLLEQDVDIKAYVYVHDADSSETIKTIQLPIVRREKPSDFVSAGNENQMILEQVLADMQTEIDKNLQDTISTFDAIGMELLKKAGRSWVEILDEQVDTNTQDIADIPEREFITNKALQADLILTNQAVAEKASTIDVNNALALKASQSDFVNLSEQVGENLTSINSKISEESSYYGIKYTISTDTVERVGNSIGKVAGLYPETNDFDSIMPFASRRRCNLGDDLVVRNYYGDVGYIEDGSNGQVMVETQGFYYRRYMPDNNTIMTLISMYELPFFTWHPYFYNEAGQKVQKKYKSAYEGSLYDVTTAVAEVNTITVTNPCTTNGNLVITLDNYTKVTIPVTTSMSTVDLVATAIRSTTFPNVVASGTGADVILTYSITGAKNTTTINVASTGVVATVAKNTTGTGRYVTGDAQIADFAVETGDKLCSIAGVKPISGLAQDLTLLKSRILANNRGAGWQQQYYNEISAEQLMMIVEFGTLKTQSIYNGDITNITDDALTNMAIYTGATSSLGNKSGKVAVTHYQTGQTTYAISYRGVENFWGNIWKWVDGLNISNGNAYVCKFNGGFVSDTFTGNYVKIGELGHVNGYISKTMLNAAHEYGFLPTEAVGTSTSKYADYYYQNAYGNFVARLGGSWADGSGAGAFCWFLNYGSASRTRFIGARLSA